MKRNATQSNAETKLASSSTGNHSAQFIGVRDSRNRRIPGLYTRNGRFYAQLWVAREDGQKTARKFPLRTAEGAPVATVGAAREAAEILRHERRTDSLPMSGHKPKFADYVATYFAHPVTAGKKRGTLNLERWALDRWKAHLGDVKIDRIDAADISALRDKRLRAGLSARSVNLDLIALRNVLKLAKDEGYIRELPRSKTLKVIPSPRRPLLTETQFAELLAAVPAGCEKNAVQFADYLRFLAYTGAREKETLKIRWRDVDFTARKVTIGADGAAKNREQRDVDFNPQLAALLADMHGRRAPDCTWLFPSPQRGPRDVPARTFRKSLMQTRDAAGLAHVGFHDLRHRFASLGVMAGLDFMTIAGWLGHKDGGLLVGKIYGHLSDTHKAQAAAKLHL